MYCWFYDEWNLGRPVRKSRPSDDGSRYEDKSVVSDPFADPTDGSGADTGIEARWDAHCRVQEGMSRWSGRALIGLFAQAALFIYLEIMMLEYIVAAALWGGDDYADAWDGRGWCDLTIRVQLMAQFGITGSIFCILLNLMMILLANRWTEYWFNSKHTKTAVELFSVVGFPLLIAVFVYFALYFRYAITQCTGCRLVFLKYGISLLLYYFWLLLWAVLCFVTALATLAVFFAKRKNTRNILQCTNSGYSLRRFSKMLIFCSLVIGAMFPLKVLSLVLNMNGWQPQFKPDFSRKLYWDTILRLPYNSFDDAERWIQIAMSVIGFALFGLGEDAVRMYVDWLETVPGGSRLVQRWCAWQESRKVVKKQNYISRNTTSSTQYSSDFGSDKDYVQESPVSSWELDDVKSDGRSPYDDYVSTPSSQLTTARDEDIRHELRQAELDLLDEDIRRDLRRMGLEYTDI
ncbi:hypothetical protein KL936_004072 [Ogataea polymorpha]|nr:hypothetical protein KL936_004072 [Ogataea polymorpha]